MSKCNECGYELQGNEELCPNCGCPTNDAGASAYMDEDVLNTGKSTDAEAVVTNVANTVLRWGNLLSWIALIYGVVGGIGGMVAINEMGGAIFTAVAGVIIGVFGFFIVRLIAKVIWGVIMLFVNISTTMKRVEILNEQILKEVKK